MVEGQTTDVEAQTKSLSGTIKVSIDAYDGLSLSKRDVTSLRYAKRAVAYAA